MDADIKSATSEVRAVQAVRIQLEGFRADMEKDSAAQRRAAGDLVGQAVQRCERFVDRTLQLSNVSGLSAYLVGPGPGSLLPVARCVDLF